MTKHYTIPELEKLLADATPNWKLEYHGDLPDGGPSMWFLVAGWLSIGGSEPDAKLAAAAPTLARQFIEQARELAKEKHEVERLTTLANEAFCAWDSDQDSRVGKLLAAMNDIGFCKTYRPDLIEPDEGDDEEDDTWDGDDMMGASG